MKMMMNFAPKYLLPGILSLLASWPVFGGEPDFREAWELNSMYRFQDAYQLLERDANGELSRETRFARALCQLTLPKKTNANVELATSGFNRLIAENADDDIGICARYFLGRIAQFHQLGDPDNAKAREFFRRLYADHPGHLMAQRAYLRAVMMEIFDPTVTVPLASRLKKLEREKPVFADNDTAKNYHLVLAQVYLTHKLSPAKALEHYLAAARLGICSWRTRSDVYVVISGLAMQLQQDDLAVRYCRKFLTDFIRDNRAYMIKERLAALQKTSIDNIQ